MVPAAFQMLHDDAERCLKYVIFNCKRDCARNLKLPHPRIEKVACLIHTGTL